MDSDTERSFHQYGQPVTPQHASPPHHAIKNEPELGQPPHLVPIFALIFFCFF
jgi:hypothetical protein